jgi:hypothetical protein
MGKSAAVVVSLMVWVVAMAAQSGPPANAAQVDEKGFTALMQFSGNVDSSGHVLKLDSTAGYNFNRHFGADLGVPVYFVGASSSGTTPGSSNNAVGNPYIDLRLKFDSAAVNYGSVITASMPLADTSTGLSTGRVTFDWTNRFDRSLGRIEPFVAAGIANSIQDSRLFDRPFTSLGFNTHLEGGTGFDLTEHISVGGSLYGILPAGNQKIYSKLGNGNANGAATTTTRQHGKMFQITSTATATPDMTRDYGFSAWFDVSPNRYLEFELGYTRSQSYDYGGIAFSLGLNIGRLLRDRPRP